MPRSSDARSRTLGRALRQAAALMAAAGVAAAMAAFFHGIPREDEKRDAAPEIALAEAQGRQPPPLWIDARPETAFQQEHLPGALPLRAEDWAALLPPVLEAWEPPGRAAVVYCDSPGQTESREVAERLREFNLGPVWVLQGGWKAWAAK